MKKKNIKGFITGHPTQTRNLLTITAMVINMLIALKLSVSTQILLAYVWGILLLVPCIITCILHAREKNAEMQSMYKNQITAKDRTISSLRRKINDDKDAVTAGEEAIRQYGELEAETQSVLLKVRAELDDHDKRSDIIKSWYVREEFPQKVYKYASFLWDYTDALDLFDPVLYMSDKKYHVWMNSSVDEWNKIIEDYSNNVGMCLEKLRRSYEKTKPKAATADTVPELERSSKKLAHISTDREDR